MVGRLVVFCNAYARIDARYQLPLGRPSMNCRHRKPGNEMNRLLSSFGILCLLTLPVVSSAFAQTGNYPDKPVTIISDSAAGSSPDVVARFVAEGLGEVWGEQVVVVNRPGANGSLAVRAASEAVADGYTLFHPTLSTFVALPTIAPNLPVKLPRDFLPVGFTAS